MGKKRGPKMWFYFLGMLSLSSFFGGSIFYSVISFSFVSFFWVLLFCFVFLVFIAERCLYLAGWCFFFFFFFFFLSWVGWWVCASDCECDWTVWKCEASSMREKERERERMWICLNEFKISKKLWWHEKEWLCCCWSVVILASGCLKLIGQPWD